MRPPGSGQSWRAGTRDVDNAFYGWNDAWLDPEFRDWDISDFLAYIRVPVAILQGADDQYGTIRQIEIAREECYCPVDVDDDPGGRTFAASGRAGTTLMRLRHLRLQSCPAKRSHEGGPHSIVAGTWRGC